MSPGLIIRWFTFSQWGSILGKLPVIPVGDLGTIPYCMRQHAEDFVGAAFDTREAGDGSIYQHVGLELVTRTGREIK
jgi:hypothetical protein